MGQEHDDWGCDGLSSSDLVIPKLTLMQSISKQVKEERARAGDIIESLGGTVIAKRGEKIPFLAFQNWRELWTLGGPKNNQKILKREPVTPENERLPWKDIVNGEEISRQLVLSFFVVSPRDLEGLPYRLQFTRSSLKAGKALSTELAILKRKKRPPASKVFLLGAEIEKKDNNDYYVFTVTGDRDASPVELAAARTWYGTLLTPQAPAIGLAPGVKPAALPPGRIVSVSDEDNEEVPF